MWGPGLCPDTDPQDTLPCGPSLDGALSCDLRVVHSGDSLLGVLSTTSECFVRTTMFPHLACHTCRRTSSVRGPGAGIAGAGSLSQTPAQGRVVSFPSYQSPRSVLSRPRPVPSQSLRGDSANRLGRRISFQILQEAARPAVSHPLPVRRSCW